MYGADELPWLLDQVVFSITMRNTVPMADDGRGVVGGVLVEVVVARAGSPPNEEHRVEHRGGTTGLDVRHPRDRRGPLVDPLGGGPRAAAAAHQRARAAGRAAEGPPRGGNDDRAATAPAPGQGGGG